MTRESRDPLSVLREILESEERHAEYEPRANHEGREAIAQVEALREVAEFAADEFRDKAHVADCRGETGLARYYAECSERVVFGLLPFTPTDSEGGGHG